MRTASDKLWGLIDSAMLGDRRRLRRALRAAQTDHRERRGGRGGRWTMERAEAEVLASIARREKRAETAPKPEYPQDLPVVQRREEIAAAIRENQVIVLCGETGSGKTTQLPKICLEIGRGVSGVIGHTQPRRIAARSVAGRIASELSTPIGQAVGYKMRFTDKTSPQTFVKVMTDGILLAETQADPLLEQYDTLIIDEAHERSLNIDFLLGYIKQLLPKRPELKLIITSATIDPERFAEHFGSGGKPAPIIEVSGRTYPVDVHYRPPVMDEDGEVDQVQAVLDAIDELSGMPRPPTRAPGEAPPQPAPHHERRRGRLDGDVLVFLSGEREIRETAEALRKHHPPGVEILPLYARLSAQEQQRVFDSHGARRIVLATNVAETSLTVPGIRYVVDPGFARISRYSSRTKVQRLPIEPISRASADQRKGRCGRVSEGVCVRLYSEEDYLARPEFTEPEILRTNLASVILQMKALRLGEVVDFPFVERPESRMIRDGYDTLHELGAVDERGALTKIGAELAHLPIDPRIGRMILAASAEGCLTEVLIIAAALSIQDPRERPMDKAEAADTAHKRFADMQKEGEESDFLTYLHIWKFYQEASEQLSHSKLRKACAQNFLSATRMREWDEVHRQLHTIVAERAGPGGAYKFNTRGGSYEGIHRALLAGLLSNVGVKAEAHEFAGARGTRFSIFPGSALFKKNPKWVMAAEVVQTTKMYARTVARIQPEWIERVGAHLVKKTFSEPHWDAPRSRVNAYEKVLLYGLEVVPRRGVHHGPIDPVVSREMFINHALVLGEYITRAPFFEHNRRLLKDVQELEAKSRKRNLMGPPEKRQAFFEKRIPAGVYSGDTFEHWRKQAERQDQKVLFMSMADVMADDAPSIASKELFPDAIVLGGRKSDNSELRVRVQYHLEPGHVDDGVTALVPLEAMNRVEAVRAEWLVPGMLREKITALIRALPKSLRTAFVPAPQFADRVTDVLEPRLKELDGPPPPLLRSLAQTLEGLTGLSVPIESWREAVLEAHLSMNFAVVDQQGKRLAGGRDLEKVKRTVRGQLRAALAKAPHARFNRDRVADWDFGDLPEQAEVRHGGLVMVGYPTVMEAEDRQALHVRLRLLDTRDASRAAMHAGVRRLFLAQVHKEMEFILKTLPGMQRLAMLYAPLGKPERLRQELATFIADRAFLHDGAEIRTEKEFRRRLDPGWCKLSEVAHRAATELETVLKEYQPLAAELIGMDSGGGASRAPIEERSRHPAAWAESLIDMREQLNALVYSGFLSETSSQWLGHYPRFLAALRTRFGKLGSAGGGGPARDLKHLAEITPLWRAYQIRAANNRENDVISPELEQFRWMIEELRVSLFAQELRTSIPVSAKRLREFWAKSIGPALPE